MTLAAGACTTTAHAQELRGPQGLEPLGTLSAPGNTANTEQTQPLAESTFIDTTPLLSGSAAQTPPSALSDPDGGRLPARRARPVEDDPYAALGLRAGSFILRPEIRQNAGFDSNPRNEPGGAGSAYARTIGRVEAQSDWLRHELRGTAQAGYTAYREFEELNAPDLAADIAARVDVRRDTRMDLELRAAQESESPGDPDLPQGIRGRPNVTRFGGTAGLTVKPNRASMTLESRADRFIYEDAELNDGTVVNNSDRTFTSYELRLRTGYELSAALEPFVEVAGNTRRHDREVDDFGIRRDSDGYEVAIGARFEPSVLLSIVGKVGYREQRPEQPELESIDGLLVQGSLIWRPTALTTVTLSADSSVAETTRLDSSGALVRTWGARLDHALRRNLLLRASLVTQTSDYSGVDYRITETTAELGVDYRLTRTLAVHGRVAHEDYRTTLPGENYTANVIEAGLTVRR
jgi:hypothetical protein